MAGDNDINLKISATDKASKVIEGVSDEVAKLDDKTIELDADTGEAKSRIQKLAEQVEGLTDNAREVRIEFAEKQLERQLQGILRQLEKVDDPVAIAITQDDLENTLRDMEELRDLAGRDIEFKVHVDDQVSTSIDKVEGSARAASASIGTIGGAIGELPGVEGLGPVAEGLGQLTEAALEGEASIGQLAGSLGIMAGTAVVLQGVQKAMQSIADTKAFNQQQVESFREALEETETAAQAVLDVIKEAEGVKGRAGGGIGGIFEGTKDITADLLDAGVKADLFVEAVTKGGPALDEVKAKITAWKKEGIDAWEAGKLGWDEVTERNQRADEAIEIVTETLKLNTEATEGNVVTQEFLATATDNTHGSFQRLKPTIDDNRAALDRHKDALNKARAATDDLKAANEKLRGDLDKREAYLNLEQTFADLKAAGTETMDAVAAGTVDAETATRGFELQQIAAKDQVFAYIDAIEDIPPEKQSEIMALIDQGKYDEALAALAALEKDRNVPLGIDASEAYRQIQELERRLRAAGIRVSSGGGGGVPVGASTQAAPTGSSASVSTTAAVVVPVRLALPNAVEIARQIGPLRLAVQAGLTATHRLNGIRD